MIYYRAFRSRIEILLCFTGRGTKVKPGERLLSHSCGTTSTALDSPISSNLPSSLSVHAKVSSMIRIPSPSLGSVMRWLRLGLLHLLAFGIAAGVSVGQAINVVENGASYIVQGLPNSGIAQGSIFVVVGTTLGPSTLAIDPNPFQHTTLENTSVSVTVGSTTVNALMYYTSSTQIAALLPSSTPVGSGTITVTYNGNASVAVPISVIENNLGIFTLTSNGAGVAIVTYPNGSLVSSVPGTGSLACPAGATVCGDTYGGAANPGDILTLWGTGLGPVSGSDASGAGLSQPIAIPTSTPLTLWIGGVAATVSYAGRSGYIGEDQINFTVPANTPLGCAVPLAVQIGTQVSNYTAIPVANGSRTCAMQNPGFSASAVQALTTSAGPINYASLELGRTIASTSGTAVNYEDIGLGEFAQISVAPINQPEVLSSLDTPPFGTCSTTNNQTSSGTLFTVNTGIDAGAMIVTGPPPDFQVSLQEQPGTGQATRYSAVFSPTGVYFSGGAYTIAAAGGTSSLIPDVAKFTTGFTITQTPTWQSSDQARLFNNGNGVTRTNGMTVNWTGGSSAYWVVITGSGGTSTPDILDGSASTSFSCWVPSINNTFAIPANILLSLPGGIEAEIDFHPTLPPQAISAGGLDVGFLLFQYQSTFFLPLN
jgi:uncharacterized protein (TIGR03437 family)